MKSDVTLRQIANELDLSAMTVSRAINDRSNVNEKTKERVLEKAQNMGYTLNHVAKSLVSNKTFTIGLVVPEITHAFFQSPLTTIQQPAYQLGKRATKKLIQTLITSTN